MAVSIGYACLVVGVPDTNMSSVIKKNATEEKLMEVTKHNLAAFEKMVDYNIKEGIMLYRISSDLIPFGSSPVNSLPWWELFKEDFERIGKKIINSGMRVSFHPGQYTVLNSPDEGVVERAIEDLRYHNLIMECLGVDYSHKMVLHVGGVYGDKETAMERFVQNFARLDEPIQKRLIIENDDRLYTVEDVLKISQQTGSPVVYDNLHHAINPPEEARDDYYWIHETSKTWKPEDGRQKMHYSQQDPGKRDGAHTKTIYLDTFMEFYRKLEDPTIDIMLEVKDKNISTVKCINATQPERGIGALEKEWARYKYSILERSQPIYQQIRSLLKDKEGYPVEKFYQLIEEALEEEIDKGDAINAAQHVWGYFRDQAELKDVTAFKRNLKKFEEDTATLATLKRQLKRFTDKYDQTYLKHSLYFDL
ncbi:UV DNA damage repair endonuclease UvsE [Desemzia sp. C1]|uniref:UV DNA damage repair endonuclease UvsE n=1 Tax=Desemzia sp. C1 TaxID=2892016 RepID=UPI001E56135B|nr:UV DNA damage repair endonuclease UvsE [Desemzia sp. C1]MCI3028810.1 UV DNA damage repair endonuclease UvsE [Desemzia sp. C1]